MVTKVLVVLVAAIATMQSASTPSVAITQALQSGDWTIKGRAIALEARTDVPRLDTTAVQALASELSASTEELILGESSTPPPPSYPVDFDSTSYWRSIGEILAREQNPAAIEALTGVISSGGPPFSAIVRFGELAVPRWLPPFDPIMAFSDTSITAWTRSSRCSSSRLSPNHCLPVLLIQLRPWRWSGW